MLKLNKISFSILSILILSLSAQAEPSYKSFFYDNSVLIYGTQNSEQTKFENITAFNLRKNMKSNIILLADDKVTEESLRNKNLIITSVNKSNNILNFLNMPNVRAMLPFEIKNEQFIFANKTYAHKNDAIVLIYPSQYNAKFYTLILYSNSVEGLENLIKIIKPNSDLDYQIVGNNKVIREGTFNKMSFTWKFDLNLDKEY